MAKWTEERTVEALYEEPFDIRDADARRGDWCECPGRGATGERVGWRAGRSVGNVQRVGSCIAAMERRHSPKYCRRRKMPARCSSAIAYRGYRIVAAARRAWRNRLGTEWN